MLSRFSNFIIYRFNIRLEIGAPMTNMIKEKSERERRRVIFKGKGYRDMMNIWAKKKLKKKLYLVTIPNTVLKMIIIKIDGEKMRKNRREYERNI